ncbi:hypothetical protein [Cyanobium sp. Copco_Reservoir_LC18]|uniref:hypothetical protein n=1 Tax=Cyanobium sp. Copco_Reservoir_LC18 TaxID=1328305 RepID=UPI001358BE50|nr:hypothetical protein [Cyanobium sp. Copco_Reservoir_LC18]
MKPSENIGLLGQDWAISAVQPMAVFSVAGVRAVIPLDGEDTAHKATVMEAALPLGSIELACHRRDPLSGKVEKIPPSRVAVRECHPTAV